MITFAADLETTTDVDDCRVWAWSMSEVENPENFCGEKTLTV